MSKHLSQRGGTNIDVQQYCKSENTLNCAIKNILELLTEIFKNTNYKIVHENIFDCSKHCSDINATMRPDGGILYLIDIKNDLKLPLLVSEDKIQGTNDKNYFANIIPEITKKKKKIIDILNKEKIDYNKNMKTEELFTIWKESKNYEKTKIKNCSIFKQALGNAIERFAKNQNGFASYFGDNDIKIFPYVIFAAGCDFSDKETIASRLEVGNYFKKNIQYREDGKYDINIGLYKEKWYASNIFIKTHYYTEKDNATFLWTKDERVSILNDIILKSLKYYKEEYNLDYTI